MSFTLVDSSTKKPAAVRHFFGVDARGLAYFKLMGGSTFALDLSAQSDSTANFAWLWTSVEAWTPDREQEALQLVTSAIRDEQPERAIEAAQRMRGIAQKSRDALSDPSLWQAICVPLEEAAGRRNQPPRQALARAAQLVGLGDVMRREVLAASAALALDESSQRFPRACGLAPLAESAGELDIALDTYRLCMELAAERGVVQTSLALDASRCAARMRRSDMAIEWASLGVDIGRGYDVRQLQEQVGLLQRYRDKSDSLEANLRFVNGYWLKHAHGQLHSHRAIDAITHLTDQFKLEGGPYRHMTGALVKHLILAGRLEQAESAVDELHDSGPHAFELALQLRLELGQAHAERGEAIAALAVFDQVCLLGEHTVFAHRARISAGRVHLDAGDPEAAYRAMKPLILLTRQGVFYLHGLNHDDCRSIALLLAEAYEALGHYEEALATARVARHRFPLYRRHHHGHSSPFADDDQRIERLQDLLVASSDEPQSSPASQR